MKITAKQVVKYRGCKTLYMLHKSFYNVGEAVDYEKFVADVNAYIDGLPEGADKSWIDRNITSRFESNYEALEECGESLSYKEEYRILVLGNHVEALSTNEVIENAKNYIIEVIGDAYDFFYATAVCETELFGIKGESTYDYDDPRVDSLKFLHYRITKRDASRVEVDTKEELDSLIVACVDEYVNQQIENSCIKQKLVADDKYVAWKPIP